MYSANNNNLSPQPPTRPPPRPPSPFVNADHKKLTSNKDNNNNISNNNLKSPMFVSNSTFYVPTTGEASSNLLSPNMNNLQSNQRCRSYNNIANLRVDNTIDSRGSNNSAHSGSGTSNSSSNSSSFTKNIKDSLRKNFEKLEKHFNNRHTGKKNHQNEVSLSGYKKNATDTESIASFDSIDSNHHDSSCTGNFTRLQSSHSVGNYNNILSNTDPAHANLLASYPYNHSQSLQEPNDRKNMEIIHNVNNNNNACRYNPNVVAINTPSIPNRTPANYSIDEETRNELNKKLALLSIEDRLELQERGLRVLKQIVEAKKAEQVSLTADIKELNDCLVAKNETVRSQFDIELLRGEIRSLTNEKAKLEIQISQRANWECRKCTLSNESHVIECQACGNPREDNEIFICNHCGTKNSLFSISCIKCNAYFAADNVPPSINNKNSGSSNSLARERRSSSNTSVNSINSTSNNHSSNHLNGLNSPGSNTPILPRNTSRMDQLPPSSPQINGYPRKPPNPPTSAGIRDPKIAHNGIIQSPTHDPSKMVLNLPCNNQNLLSNPGLVSPRSNQMPNTGYFRNNSNGSSGAQSPHSAQSWFK